MEPQTEGAAGVAGEAADQTTDSEDLAEQTSTPENQENLHAQLDEARREASENYDRYLRVHADMENYKKRIERTYADLARNAKKDLLLKLLSVKDNLERALSYGAEGSETQDEGVLKGVRLTEYQLDQLLRTEGVTPMDIKGKPFDPQQADALGTVVDPQAADHSVAEVVQQGYCYQDQVLRPAKVMVAVRESGEEA